jgi:aldehyde dehydrogenase (NAD+)
VAELERKRGGTPVPAEWTYAPAPEARDIVSIRDRYGLYVGGEWLEPRSGKTFSTIDPSTEEPLAEIAQAGPEDVSLAVAAARDAFENGWSDLAPS